MYGDIERKDCFVWEHPYLCAKIELFSSGGSSYSRDILRSLLGDKEDDE